MIRKNLIRAAVVGAFLFPMQSFAAVPTTMTQQGRLLQEDGAPVSGTKSIRFALYDAATGGTLLWESVDDVAFDATGFYTAVLGDGTNPLDAMVFADGAAYLTMAVDGGEEMTPRHPVTSVPYAQIAGGVADGSVTTAALAPGFALSPAQVPAPDWSTLTNIPVEIADGDADALGGISCNVGQVAGWTGSNWACVDVLTSGTTTLSSLSCSSGQVASYINGVWGCATIVDTNTIYAAGTGLTLNGTTFNFDPTYTVPNATNAANSANANTLDNIDSTGFLRLASNNTVTGATTFNNSVTVNGFAQTQAKRVYRDKAGTIGPAGQDSTYLRRDQRLHLVNSRRQETLQIPHADLLDLCGDEDGCTMSVSMRKWNTAIDSDVQANALGRVHFSYNSANGVWRFSENAAGGGRDGDSVETNRDMGWNCCYVSDMQYVSTVAQNDGAQSMYLLNWTSSTCPLASNLECHMTIDD